MKIILEKCKIGFTTEFDWNCWPSPAGSQRVEDSGSLLALPNPHQQNGEKDTCRRERMPEKISNLTNLLTCTTRRTQSSFSTTEPSAGLVPSQSPFFMNHHADFRSQRFSILFRVSFHAFSRLGTDGALPVRIHEFFLNQRTRFRWGPLNF